MISVSRFRLSDGGFLAYAVLGRRAGGVPVLLHRPLGGSIESWGPFAERIAHEYRVIVFDPRGVGRSSDAPLFHSTRDMARDAVDLLEGLDVPVAFVFGLSLGAMVASWMAVDRPARVSRLVLASTLPSLATVSHRVAGALLRLARALARPGSQAELALVRAILSPEFRRNHPNRVRAIEASVRRVPTSRRNLAVLLFAAARHNVEACLRSVDIETLLLVGGRDRIAGVESQRALLEALPDAALEVIPESGHDLSLEQPLVTAERVLEFFRAREPHVGRRAASFPGP